MNEAIGTRVAAPDGGVLPEWLARRALLTPTVPGLVSALGTWTFRELDAQAVRLAWALSAALGKDTTKTPGPAAASKGVGPRIGLLIGNTPTFVVAVHAVAKFGAVLLPLNTRLTPRELAWQLADAGAVVLLHDNAHAEAAYAATKDLPSVPCLCVKSTAAGFDISAPVDSTRNEQRVTTSGGTVSEPSGFVLRDYIHVDDLHSIVYTSGTTGRPKGAMLTYGNFWWNVTASALNLGVMPSDRWLACMPLFHVGGLSILLRSVVYGMPLLLHASFDAVAVNAAIDEDGVSLLSVVAVMLERMLEERGDKQYPSSLRAVLVGGGPAPPALLERAAALGAPILPTYGLTEAASQVATAAPGEALRKLGSAGKPLFPTRLLVDASPGEVGEIVVAGPTISPGYWNRDEGTVSRPDGWLRTGDVGFLDEEGYLYVVDRREDLIVSGGENVYPAEVEAVLASHPDILEAAVVGVPDDKWGQVPVAVVAPLLGRDPTAGDVQAWCRERLAAYKAPAQVVFVAALPRNAAGKLLRNRIRETL